MIGDVMLRFGKEGDKMARSEELKRSARKIEKMLKQIRDEADHNANHAYNEHATGIDVTERDSWKEFVQDVDNLLHAYFSPRGV